MTKSLLILLLLVTPSLASAQSVTATFNLSADHNVTWPTATGPVNLVTRYEARLAPTTGPVLARDLGKPLGSNGGTVVVPGIPALAGSYTGGVICAIGPGGEGCSLSSGPFTVMAPPTPAPKIPSGTPEFK